jgi:hypothetical protein
VEEEEEEVEEETDAVALRMTDCTSICNPVACKFCSASKIAGWNFPVVSNESAFRYASQLALRSPIFQ